MFVRRRQIGHLLIWKCLPGNYYLSLNEAKFQNSVKNEFALS